jgi:Domain of unknown function (DUF4062)
MTPRVFISSTIRDLAHVRHALRDAILELGYQPVMSDYGEVGYLPDFTAADSCFKEAENCDLGILIIAKRYGDNYLNNVSATHGEFRTLHSRKVPIVTLVEKDVLTIKHLLEANRGAAIDCPGMDRPSDTCALVDEIGSSQYNNGIHEFHQLSDARRIVSQQFGHIFGRLLRERYDPLRTDIKDILASIATLRDDLQQQRSDPISNRFLRASRELLEDDCVHYKKLLTQLLQTFDRAVHAILEAEDFDGVISKTGLTVEIVDSTAHIFGDRDVPRQRFAEAWGVHERSGQPFGMGYSVTTTHILLTEPTRDQFRANHLRIRSAAAP